MDYFSKRIILRPKRNNLCRIETRVKNWLFWLQKSNCCNKTPIPNYMDLNTFG